MSSKQKFLFSVSLLLLLLAGFFRDFFMLNINHILMHLKKGYPNIAPDSFHFLAVWSIEGIMTLKWFMTIFFFLFFWGISYWVLKLYFAQKNIKVHAISYIYIILFGAAGLLYLTGLLFGISKSMYHVVRTLTGLTHTFLPAMLAFLYLQYFPKENTEAISPTEK